MGGTMAQQKTLTRKLLKEARTDFPQLFTPDFPPISRQMEQAVHLKRPDWDRLFQQMVELSGGTARRELSVKQY